MSYECPRLLTTVVRRHYVFQANSYDLPRLRYVASTNAVRPITNHHDLVRLRLDSPRSAPDCATNHHDCTTTVLRLLPVYSDVRTNRTDQLRIYCVFELAQSYLGSATNSHDYHECPYDDLMNAVRMPYELKNQPITPDSFEHVQNSREHIPMTHEHSRILATPLRWYYDCCRCFTSWLVGSKLVTVRLGLNND